MTYPASSDAKFDRDYYTAHHIPLVNRIWGPLGLISATAFFPSPTDNGNLAICECVFTGESALKAALDSPDTPVVMDDVKNFTAIEPVILKGVAL
ncbi:EthD family reductase [Komagataeibacter oboediens]|uniref:EthD family reductase n=1 Tax=Komagataeibacter oboediens TaxID=65958 RepID=A0ABS5SQ44_9PROT|nr:EthD family reductase [Komagataeibacter oboediens]MBT0676407.1 EthD family reductase [Komagataeibacter oboediens]MBT0679741.1 EthD family reductase [Komagataeibacter oboediens]